MKVSNNIANSFTKNENTPDPVLLDNMYPRGPAICTIAEPKHNSGDCSNRSCYSYGTTLQRCQLSAPTGSRILVSISCSLDAIAASECTPLFC